MRWSFATFALALSCGAASAPASRALYAPPRTHGTYLERRAAHPTVLTRRAPAMADWPKDEPPDSAKRVTYRSGALELMGWFAMPDAAAKRPVPALVYFHGGLALDRSEFEHARPFLRAGFAVFTPAFRGRNGNPGSFELVLGEVDDAAAAVKWTSEQPDVDRAKVYTFGHSMGGAASAMLSVRPDVTIALGGSSGGIYPADTFRDWARSKGSSDLVRFDANDGDEVELRLLGPFATQLVHDHVAFFGVEETDFHAEGQAIAKRAKGARFEVVEVPGDHFSALDPAMASFLERVTTAPR